MMINLAVSSKRIFRSLLSFGVAVWSISGRTPAAEGAASCHEAIEQARSALNHGSFQRAESLLRSAILARSQTVDIDVVLLWNQMGAVHQGESQLVEAEQDYKRAIQLNEELAAPDAMAMALSLNNLGTIAESRHLFPLAEGFCRRAYSVLEQATLLSTSITGPILTNLAASIDKQGRHTEAAPFYTQALKQVLDSYGDKSLEYAKALTNFGLFKFEIGEYHQALEAQSKAYNIQRSLPFVSDMDMASAANNLALTLFKLGYVAEAEGYFRKAITLEKTSSGAPDPSVVETLNNLAVLEENGGRLIEARRDQVQALDIALRELPHGDPIFATIWNNLGMIAAAQRRFQEAEDLYQKAAAAWLKQAGPESPGYAAVISNMAGIAAKQKHRTQARELYKKAIQIDESALGADHPKVAVDLCNLGVQKAQQRKYGESIALFRRAQEIEETAFGPENRELARTWRNLAVVYLLAKQPEAANLAYQRAIHILDNAGNQSLDLMKCLYEYADLLRKEERFGEAETAEVQAMGIRVRNAIAIDAHAEHSRGVSVFK